jgi:triacylglycerol lipase
MESNLQSESTAAKPGDVLNYGDTIYLQHMNGDYVTQFSKGKTDRYHWPKLGKNKKLDKNKKLRESNNVKLQILGDSSGELTDGAVIRLKSTELLPKQHNVLGSWSDSHDCYYWSDNFHPKKQSWQINKRDKSGDNKIRYGDDVYLTNLHYKNQRLARCTHYDGYISKAEDVNEWWQFQPEVAQEYTKISSEGAFLESAFEPNTRTFSPGNLAYLAYFAEAAYGTPDESKAKLEKLGFQINGHEHYLDFPDTDTQGLMVGDDEKIIVAFRGTENLTDWLTNIKLLKASWKVGMVHAGFYKSLESLWPDAIGRLKSLRNNNQPIWITGHSLGGALATLAGATLDDEMPEFEVAGIYTFGQPRVGDQIFAQSLDKGMKERFFRAVNNNDIVPRVPSLKFNHVGNLLYFDSDGKLNQNMSLSWLNPKAWSDRLRGVFKSTVNLELESDSVGDHRMGDYRRLAMRQLDKV